jgi:hypothetical protein
VSHRKEREEKICLNCGTPLEGRFCHICGQENTEPKESVWGLLTHYVYDIIHFDGKFFSTLKTLIAKPGFLPKEYMQGRRASYLNPIRMYVFTSAFFFLLFFAFFYSQQEINITGKNRDKKNTTEKGNKNSAIKIDTSGFFNEKGLLNKVASKEDSLAVRQGFNALKDTIKTQADSGSIKFSVSDNKYPTVAYYDSVQKQLPEAKRDNWFMRTMRHREISINNKYDNDPNKILTAYIDKFMHTLPQILFVSLPLFAFLLWLVYIRKGKAFYYADHIIFTVFLYIFNFITLFVFFIFNKLNDAISLSLWGWLNFALWVYSFYYLYKAMRVFYGQRRFKTIVKFLIVNFLSFIFLMLVFIAYMIITAFQI